MLKKRGSDQLDIIFEAGEDLMNSSKNQVIILKNNSIRLPIIKPRTFLSYSLEFCGITGLNYKQLRFQSLGRDIRPETSIMTASLVKVIHTNEFNQMVQNPLKTSLQNLFLGGIFSDVILKINDEIVLPLHKCILSCRSPKFNGMFSCNLMESTQSIIKVECKKPELFKLMLGWIYSGYWKEFPDNIADACDLMLLADEYMIMDLKQKCEEDIISKLDISNILQVLLFVEKYCDILSPIIVDKAHSLFIDDFDQILRLNPNLEQDITKVPGLMTKLFLNYNQLLNNFVNQLLKIQLKDKFFNRKQLQKIYKMNIIIKKRLEKQERFTLQLKNLINRNQIQIIIHRIMLEIIPKIFTNDLYNIHNVYQVKYSYILTSTTIKVVYIYKRSIPTIQFLYRIIDILHLIKSKQ